MQFAESAWKAPVEGYGKHRHTHAHLYLFDAEIGIIGQHLTPALIAEIEMSWDPMSGSFKVTEDLLTRILVELPDEEDVLRPYLQKAGENRFGW